MKARLAELGATAPPVAAPPRNLPAPADYPAILPGRAWRSATACWRIIMGNYRKRLKKAAAGLRNETAKRQVQKLLNELARS
jgi:hypothetical protein